MNKFDEDVCRRNMASVIEKGRYLK
jgi:hypothetical protein